MKYILLSLLFFTTVVFGQTQSKVAEFNQANGIDYKQNLSGNTDFEKNINGVVSTNPGSWIDPSGAPDSLITGKGSFLSGNSSDGDTDKFPLSDFDQAGRREFTNRNCSASADVIIISDVTTFTHQAYVENAAGDQISAVIDLYATSGTAVPNHKSASISELYFPCPTTTANLVIKRRTASSALLSVDNIYGGKARGLGTVGNVGPRTAYTPVVQGFSSLSNVDCYSTLNGSYLDIDCKFTAGGVNGSEAQVGLPAGYTSSNTTGLATIHNAGTVTRSGTGAVSLYALAEPNKTYIVFSAQSGSSGGLTKLAGSALISAAETISILAKVPIQGGTSTSIANLSLPSNGSFLHDGADCSFSRTNTAYGTPAADSTCTFSTILNNNIGTVTSALSGSDKLSGLVWTPNRTGTAKICANIGMSGSGSGVTMSARLIDNAGLRIAENSVTTSTGTQAEPMYFCGLSNIDAAGAPLTYLVQTKATSGSVTVGLTQSIAIQWTITWESNGSPAPFLTGGQVSNYPGVEKPIRGKVMTSCTSPPCTVTNSNEPNLAITRATNGDYTATFPAYRDIPTCLCFAGNTSTAVCQRELAVTTTTTFRFGLSPIAGGSLIDGTFSIFCLGAR